jgi:hypothetical protein
MQDRNTGEFDDVLVAGLPEGLRARVQPKLRSDSGGIAVEVRDRRGRRKLDSVWLYVTTSDPISPNATELTFLLGAQHREWKTIVAALGAGDGDRAWKRVCDLVRGGAIELECLVDGVALGVPRRWRLTDSWEQRRRQRTTRRTNDHAAWSKRADSAAQEIIGRYPQLAHALGRHRGPVERKVLVHAAEDLVTSARITGRARSRSCISGTPRRATTSNGSSHAVESRRTPWSNSGSDVRDGPALPGLPNFGPSAATWTSRGSKGRPTCGLTSLDSSSLCARTC